MSTRPTSPRSVAVTVARLDESSAWRRYTTDATGAGWVRLDERLADPVALDDWYRDELAGTARGHADLAGSLSSTGSPVRSQNWWSDPCSTSGAARC